MFNDFIDRGLANGMVVPSQLEQALCHTFWEDGSFGHVHGLDLHAHRFGNHMRHCFNMFRVVLLEEKSSSTVQTAKKQVEIALQLTIVVVRTLVAKVKLPEADAAFMC